MTPPEPTPPLPDLARLRALAADVPTLGPWRRYRSPLDGALVLEDIPTAEPVVLAYGGLRLALYLQACAPAVLFGGAL